MAVPAYIGPLCASLLTTTVTDTSPIAWLLSPKGLMYSKPWANITDEAQDGCRLCRILKDFIDQADEKSRARRNRLQGAAAIVSNTPEEERAVRFVLRLSGRHLMINTPDDVFAGTLQYRATTNFGTVTA